MKNISLKSEFNGTVEEAVIAVTHALQGEGFGVLTRIDLDKKFQEKLGKTIPPAVILGACAPAMAFEAYTANSDVALLLPCNVVLRETGTKKISVEIARPSTLLEILADPRLSGMASEADNKLGNVVRFMANAHNR
ncbi:MAG: DUF302 domain-containing protein [Bdellovibrionota bacterium]